MKKIGSVLKAVSKGFSVISFVGLFVGVIFVVVDVVLRYFFDSPIHGDYDITQLWLSVIVFAALAYVQTERGHIGVTMVLKVLPEKLGVALYGIGTLIGAATCGCCSYSFYLLAKRAIARKMVSLMAGIPLWPFEVFEIVCTALLALVMLFDAIEIFAAVGDETKRREIIDNWE